MIWNIPNMMSMLRFASAPILVLLLILGGPIYSFIAAIIFSLAAITDLLDGYIARRTQQVTKFGQLIDPIADKILIISVLIMMIPMDDGRIPAWMVFIIVAREIMVTGLRAIAAGEGVIIPASGEGKLKTTFQISAIIPLLIHYTYFGIPFHLIGYYLIWIAVVLTLWSGINYFIKAFAKIKGLH